MDDTVEDLIADIEAQIAELAEVANTNRLHDNRREILDANTKILVLRCEIARLRRLQDGNRQ